MKFLVLTALVLQCAFLALANPAAAAVEDNRVVDLEAAPRIEDFNVIEKRSSAGDAARDIDPVADGDAKVRSPRHHHHHAAVVVQQQPAVCCAPATPAPVPVQPPVEVEVVPEPLVAQPAVQVVQPVHLVPVVVAAAHHNDHAVRKQAYRDYQNAKHESWRRYKDTKHAGYIQMYAEKQVAKQKYKEQKYASKHQPAAVVVPAYAVAVAAAPLSQPC